MACHQMAKKSMFSQNRNPDTLYIIKISMNLIEFTYFSILQLRVPKESMPGLPYLRNSSIDNFIINIILLLLVQEYGNLSQKSRKRDSRTFYFEATCELKLLSVCLSVQIINTLMLAFRSQTEMEDVLSGSTSVSGLKS